MQITKLYPGTYDHLNNVMVLQIVVRLTVSSLRSKHVKPVVNAGTMIAQSGCIY